MEQFHSKHEKREINMISLYIYFAINQTTRLLNELLIKSLI